AREDGGQWRTARAVADRFLGGAELHEDAREALREAVVDLLADAVALGEHGGFLRRDAELLHADGERGLVREREHDLHALGRQWLGLPEHEREEPDVALAEDEWHQIGGAMPALLVPARGFGPQRTIELLDLEEHRTVALLEQVREARVAARHDGGEGRLADLAVFDVQKDAPLLLLVEAGGVARGG